MLVPLDRGTLPKSRNSETFEFFWHLLTMQVCQICLPALLFCLVSLNQRRFCWDPPWPAGLELRLGSKCYCTLGSVYRRYANLALTLKESLKLLLYLIVSSQTCQCVFPCFSGLLIWGLFILFIQSETLQLKRCRSLAIGRRSIRWSLSSGEFTVTLFCQNSMEDMMAG